MEDNVFNLPLSAVELNALETHHVVLKKYPNWLLVVHKDVISLSDKNTVSNLTRRSMETVFLEVDDMFIQKMREGARLAATVEGRSMQAFLKG